MPGPGNGTDAGGFEVLRKVSAHNAAAVDAEAEKVVLGLEIAALKGLERGQLDADIRDDLYRGA